MSTWVVLATGPSMSQAVADSVRGRCGGVVAVSDAYRLAPWADALVSYDAAWWHAHRAALEFAGRKFCGFGLQGTELLSSLPPFAKGCNSGLQGMRIARDVFKATKIILLGFDMHGTHYFGKHLAPLTNTHPLKFDRQKEQFRTWRGPPVVNCTPGSELTCFPMGTLAVELE